jgi:hypothetical protein
VRILYSHRIQSHDGQGVHIEALVAALRAAGHEVCVVGPPAYDAVALGGESPALARIRRLLPGALRELAEMAYGLISTARLARATRTFRPDIAYERANLFHFAGSWTAWRRGVPLLLEVNAPLAEERIRFSGLRLKRLARAAERFVWRSADFVLPVTEVLAGRDAALRARLGAAARAEVLRRDYTWAGNARRVVALRRPGSAKDGTTDVRRICLIGRGRHWPPPLERAAVRSAFTISFIISGSCATALALAAIRLDHLSDEPNVAHVVLVLSASLLLDLCELCGLWGQERRWA